MPLIRSEKLDTPDPISHTNLPSLLRRLKNWLENCDIHLKVEDYLTIIGLVAAYDYPLEQKSTSIDLEISLLNKFAESVELTLSSIKNFNVQQALIQWLLGMYPNFTDSETIRLINEFLESNSAIFRIDQIHLFLFSLFKFLQCYLYYAEKKQKIPGKTAFAIYGETMTGKSFLVYKAVNFLFNKKQMEFLSKNGGPYTQIDFKEEKLTIYNEFNLLPP